MISSRSASRVQQRTRTGGYVVRTDCAREVPFFPAGTTEVISAGRRLRVNQSRLRPFWLRKRRWRVD